LAAVDGVEVVGDGSVDAVERVERVLLSVRCLIGIGSTTKSRLEQERGVRNMERLGELGEGM
jgi:hypothetical protein